MRRISLWICIFLTAGILSYLAIFCWLIPKTATLSLPQRWRVLPVGQSKLIARSYLGDSFANDSSGITGSEKWSYGAKDRLYVLQLTYHDSVVTGYSIRYQFHNTFLSRNYLLDTLTSK